MKRTVALLLPLLVLACRSAAPPAVEAFGPGTAEIVEKTHALNRAVLHRDQAALDALLAREYTFHYIDHGMRGTMQAMPFAPRGKWVVRMLTAMDTVPLQSAIVDARAYGDLGIVLSHYRWSGSRLGEGFAYEGYITDVWIRRGGRWQLLAGHASLLTPAQ